MTYHVNLLNPVPLLQDSDHVSSPLSMFLKVELAVVLVVNLNDRVNGMPLHCPVQGYLAVLANVGPENRFGNPRLLSGVNHVFLDMVRETATMKEEGWRRRLNKATGSPLAIPGEGTDHDQRRNHQGSHPPLRILIQFTHSFMTFPAPASKNRPSELAFTELWRPCYSLLFYYHLTIRC